MERGYEGASHREAPQVPPPDVLLTAAEPSTLDPERVARMTRALAAVHGIPLDVGVEPLPEIRFADEGHRPVGE
jgi:hypothetical protein